MAEPSELLEQVITIIRAANKAVLEVYNSDDFGVEIKDDNTPLTKADKAANQIITSGLNEISNWPVMSEEGAHDIAGDTFWCVDPVDGTKEFVKRNGEFTINIGLIKNGQPVLGVVSIPAQDTIYYGAEAVGSYKQIGYQSAVKIEAKFNSEKPVVAISRSHNNSETEAFLADLGEHETVQTGSSIKFLLVAEGKATIFPCLSDRNLWDTAAADAVLRAAGGSVIARDTQQPISYDPTHLLNSNFAAIAEDQALLLSHFFVAA